MAPPPEAPVQTVIGALLDEANATVTAYAHHQPQSADDRYRMELLITDFYSRAKDYASMNKHAQQMLESEAYTASDS